MTFKSYKFKNLGKEIFILLLCIQIKGGIHKPSFSS
jgi:hypothetical protein